MKSLYNALVIIAAVCALFAATPAGAAKHKTAAATKAAPAKTAAADDVPLDIYTVRGTTGVLSLENLHQNGSTCLTCSNGIYGTSGTHNMHSNEF